MAEKKPWYTEDDFSNYSLKFCSIWQNFYFYHLLNNENLKMEVEQTISEAHSIITVQLYYWLSKNPSVKIRSNKFQMVMINIASCVQIYRKILWANFM